MLRPGEERHEHRRLLEQPDQALVFVGQVLLRQLAIGDLVGDAERTAHTAIVQIDRRKRKRPPGLLRAAVPIHADGHFLEARRVAGKRGLDRPTHGVPRIGPQRAQWRAQRTPLARAQDRGVGVVVEECQRLAPHQIHAFGRAEDEVDRAAQRCRPLCWRPEWRQCPIVLSHRLRHGAGTVRKCRRHARSRRTCGAIIAHGSGTSPINTSTALTLASNAVASVVTRAYMCLNTRKQRECDIAAKGDEG